MATAGIDVGTSYTSICLLDKNGQPERLRIATGMGMFGDEYSIPSAVFVETDGRLLLGQAAVTNRMRIPENYKSEFKRDIGQIAPYTLGGRQYLPEDLYKEFFIYLKKCAEEYTNESVTEATVTCPASFNPNKRKLIESTAKRAGLLNTAVLDEPSAAAYCYLNAGKLEEGDILMVYDLGGGTFDVSLMQYKGGSFDQIVSPLGSSNCGGTNFDHLIFDHIMEHIGEERLERIRENALLYRNVATQMMDTAIKAKHHLSSAEVFHDYLTVGYEPVEYTLTRSEYNGMIALIVDETMRQVGDILKNAGIQAKDVNKVLLVGGSSRTPLVRVMLRRVMEKEPLKDIDPELAVCAGAAVYQKLQEKKDDISRYRSAAEKGDAEAQYKIGLCYYEGKDVTLDYEKAVEWFKKSAEQENAAAQYTLGLLYLGGHGVEKDDKRATYWLEKAAKQGNTDAVKKLAELEANSSDAKEKRGNTVGNIANFGFAAYANGWVYYQNDSDSDKLYKMRTDGSEKVKLNDDNSDHINVVDGWIYYRNFSDSEKLYKIRTDGSERTKLNDDKSSDINVVDGWIYYTNGSDSGKPYKMRMDGGERTKLNDDNSEYINVVDGWIYYRNYSDSEKLYKMRTDGSGRTKLSDDKSANINVVNGWIYYIDGDFFGKLYKIRIDGSERTKLSDDKCEYINVVDGWIYYANDSDGGIYKIRTNGNERTKLNSDIWVSMGINIVEGWIFYMDVLCDIYQMRLDGTEGQRVDEPGYPISAEKKDVKGKLTLRRRPQSSTYGDMAIYINEKLMSEILKNDSTVEFDLEQGKYTVQLKCLWVKSKAVEFIIGPDSNHARYDCSWNEIWGRILIESL